MYRLGLIKMLDFIISRHLWALAFLPGVLASLYARWRFGRGYQASTLISTEGRLNGARSTRILLDRNGMANVELYETPHSFSDHYDPRRRCVFLSIPVAEKQSVAALGLTAHVVGHAIQFKQEHRFFRLRMTLIGITGWVTNALLLMVVLGLFSTEDTKAFLLVGASSLYLLFVTTYLLSLTVEYEASRIALRELLRHKIIQESETAAVNRMLKASVWLDVPGLLLAYLGVFRFFFGRKHHGVDG